MISLIHTDSPGNKLQRLWK